MRCKVNGADIEADEFGFDGCHKFFICNSPEEGEQLSRWNYEIHPMEDLPRLWEGSCPARFISSANLEHQYVRQNEPAYFEGFDINTSVSHGIQLLNENEALAEANMLFDLDGLTTVVFPEVWGNGDIEICQYTLPTGTMVEWASSALSTGEPRMAVADEIMASFDADAVWELREHTKEFFDLWRSVYTFGYGKGWMFEDDWNERHGIVRAETALHQGRELQGIDAAKAARKSRAEKSKMHVEHSAVAR